MAIKSISESDKFKKIFNRLDKMFKKRVFRLIQKLVENPNAGKPMKYDRRGTREVYLKPFRLSYSYSQQESKITLLDLYHKKKQ